MTEKSGRTKDVESSRKIFFMSKEYCGIFWKDNGLSTIFQNIKGLGSIDAVFGLIFKMADVTRYDSTRFGNYENGVLIRCMAGYHGNAHISKITVLKR